MRIIRDQIICSFRQLKMVFKFEPRPVLMTKPTVIITT